MLVEHVGPLRVRIDGTLYQIQLHYIQRFAGAQHGKRLPMKEAGYPLYQVKMECFILQGLPGQKDVRWEDLTCSGSAALRCSINDRYSPCEPSIPRESLKLKALNRESQALVTPRDAVVLRAIDNFLSRDPNRKEISGHLIDCWFRRKSFSHKQAPVAVAITKSVTFPARSTSAQASHEDLP